MKRSNKTKCSNTLSTTFINLWVHFLPPKFDSLETYFNLSLGHLLGITKIPIKHMLGSTLATLIRINIY